MTNSEVMTDPGDCLFCKIAAGEIPADIILSTDSVLAFRDIAPTAPTHALVIPRKHYADADQVAIHEPLLLAEMVRLAGQVAQLDGLVGYRLVSNKGAIAGQSVFHAHLHVLGGRVLHWPAG
ncbi:MAG TPA: histidine triad nucleotide-binding protein [Candidatus Nanopelagicaceae bacterium]|nr:histidine triad nucleotide-binding protein [Candidatus Nanopelagicaceae bacterium]